MSVETEDQARERRAKAYRTVMRALEELGHAERCDVLRAVALIFGLDLGELATPK